MNWNGLTANSFWYDEHRLLFNRDSRAMADLPDEYIQMVVTSPPYWGLRKYAGLPDLVWGGKDDCQHQWGDKFETGDNRFRAPSGSIVGGNNNPDITKGGKMLSTFCSLCGAVKSQLGLESTPELYISHLVEIFREVRRVLRKDGVVFINCGDSYFGGGFGTSPGGTEDFAERYPKQASNKGTAEHEDRKLLGNLKKRHPILKPKDLCLIPFRLAIALQEDGWWVRSVIIWNKPNPMPESVTDRPTESHEYILMLTKSSRYYYDQEAVREAYTEPLNRWGGPEFRDSSHKYIELGGHDGEQHYGATSMFRKGRPVRPIETGRNLRSVWTFPTQPYPEAHFATYPEKLVEICVKAATPEVGCCSKCGKPWVRIVQPTKEYEKLLGTWTPDTDADPELRAEIGFAAHGKKVATSAQYETLGWKPQCKCNADKVPSIVLDPFAGSGTTLKVAAELNRRAIGYELSEQYCQLTVERNRQGVFV